MSATLAAWVHMPDSDGTTVSFGPGSTPPEWAARQITNPKAWTDGQVPSFDDEPDPAADLAQPEPVPEPEPVLEKPDQDEPDPAEPEPVEPAPTSAAKAPRQRRTTKQ